MNFLAAFVEERSDRRGVLARRATTKLRKLGSREGIDHAGDGRRESRGTVWLLLDGEDIRHGDLRASPSEMVIQCICCLFRIRRGYSVSNQFNFLVSSISIELCTRALSIYVVHSSHQYCRKSAILREITRSSAPLQALLAYLAQRLFLTIV